MRILNWSAAHAFSSCGERCLNLPVLFKASLRPSLVTTWCTSLHEVFVEVMTIRICRNWWHLVLSSLLVIVFMAANSILALQAPSSILCFGGTMDQAYNLTSKSYAVAMPMSNTSKWLPYASFPIAFSDETCLAMTGDDVARTTYIYCTLASGFPGALWTSYMASVHADGTGWSGWKALPAFNGGHWQNTVMVYTEETGHRIYAISPNSGYLEVNGDEVAEAWTPQPTYPSTIKFPFCVFSSVATSIVCVGGSSGQFVWTKLAYYLDISNDSSSDFAWKPFEPYPFPIDVTSCLSYESWIYCIGGINKGIGVVVPYVYGIEYLGNATWGNWTLVSSLPSPTSWLHCLLTGDASIVCITMYGAPTLCSSVIGPGILSNWTSCGPNLPSSTPKSPSTSRSACLWAPVSPLLLEESLICIGGFVSPACDYTGAIYATSAYNESGASSFGYYSTYPLSPIVEHSCISTGTEIVCMNGETVQPPNGPPGPLIVPSVFSTNTTNVSSSTNFTWIQGQDYPWTLTDLSCILNSTMPITSGANIFCFGGRSYQNGPTGYGTNLELGGSLSFDPNAKWFNGNPPWPNPYIFPIGIDYVSCVAASGWHICVGGRSNMGPQSDVYKTALLGCVLSRLDSLRLHSPLGKQLF